MTPSARGVPVTSGQASFTASCLVPGPHTIQAFFINSNRFRPSISPEIAHQVRRGPDVVHDVHDDHDDHDHAAADDNDGHDYFDHDDYDDYNNVARPSPDDDGDVVVGEPVGGRSGCDLHGHRDNPLPALVPAPSGSAGAAMRQQVVEGGSVTFSDGGTVLATVVVEGEQATFTTSSLSAGAHTVTATFSGTATTAPSSATIIQQVDEPEPPTTQPASALPATR